MQAIHNQQGRLFSDIQLFQRAKIQDKCKQFTTTTAMLTQQTKLFQRAKIQDKCKQFTTELESQLFVLKLFQRAKIQDKCKQFTTQVIMLSKESCCFKEQRYKINASNSQHSTTRFILTFVVSKSKDTR